MLRLPPTGWWRLRVWADGYRETWTPRFEIRRDETTEVDLRVKRLNRLRARVLDPDGRPLTEGVLSIRFGDHKGTLTIRDGVVDTRVPLDQLDLRVDRRFRGMEGFREQAWPVSLRYGETTDITIRLEHP